MRIADVEEGRRTNIRHRKPIINTILPHVWNVTDQPQKTRLLLDDVLAKIRTPPRLGEFASICCVVCIRDQERRLCVNGGGELETFAPRVAPLRYSDFQSEGAF